jgi:ABC-type cobalamin/Fe3+-siderophores transport system ATPase subunit
MAEYQGMRWFKCDFQMQTPADAKHWLGQKMVDSPEGKRAAAHEYVQRCYDVGLEVIAITDHNFASREFIPFLRDATKNFELAYGYEIAIFPGFELEADVGKGCHVLALFEPDTSLETIDHILTECGVGHPRFKANGEPVKSTKRLPEILDIVQRRDSDGKQRGLVILPHPFRDGIFDGKNINNWLQQEEFLNPDLLAIEVPKAVSLLNQNIQKALLATADCDPNWKRGRAIACVMSSDNKVLHPEEDGDRYIGRRYTWVKISQPSIEGLRQAFLDNTSRIELPIDPQNSQRPSDLQNHPRIRSFQVSGIEFVKDQDIALSPNLNCLIGGRGSGKSTLLECLRLALGKDAANSIKVKDKLDRLQGLFTTNTAIQVEWEGVKGQVDELLLRPKQGEHRLIGLETPDFQTYLRRIPVQFFSQQQLSELTGSSGGNRLLQLIDEACASELQSLVAEERTVRTEIQQLFAARDQHEAVKGNIARLKQEMAELDRQWQARKDVQLDAQAHQRAQQAKDYLFKLRARFGEEAGRLRALGEDVGEAVVPLGSEAAHWPHADWFKELEGKLETLAQEVQATLGQAATRLESGLQGFIEQDPNWPAIENDLASAETRFLAACQERGLQPQDVTRLQEIDRQRQAKQNEIAAQEKLEKQLAVRIQAIPERVAEFHGVWRKQFELRSGVAESVNDKVNGAIKVSVLYSADADNFTATWERLSPDRRSKLGRNWVELGESLFAAFQELQQSEPNGDDDAAKSVPPASPWELAEAVALGKGDADTFLEFMEYADDLGKQLKAIKNDWLQARLTRVADLVDIELFRDVQGKLVSAGKVSDTRLSEGQRNTAVLNLLLAQGDGPIVIDQPEDELDSNFIYRDLVPLLRRVKNGRQVILATHNANLPVNGDAELIVALEASGDHGDKRADGGLDRAAVTSAVLDIMEGSAEAFRRRREKYHF